MSDDRLKLTVALYVSGLACGMFLAMGDLVAGVPLAAAGCVLLLHLARQP